MPEASGQFQMDSWDEQTYQELQDGAKLTRVSAKQTFSGDLEGAGAVEWLMAYRPDGSARYVGLQRVEGRLAGRSGSFVAETIGDFSEGVASWTLKVVPGSGTGDLAGLEGDGDFEAPHGHRASFRMEYRLPER